MTLDDALHAFAAPGNELPRSAMQWSLDRWDEAGPRFVALLDAYARGSDRSEDTERALLVILHLLGEKRETAAFEPLCRLLHDREAADLILGDAITTTLRQILVSLYDGNLAALKGVVEAVEADAFVREAALLAMAYLARTDRVPEAEMHAYLLRLFAEMQPQAEDLAWVGWVMAVSRLGYGDLTEQAEALFRRGFVPPDVMAVSHFQEDLRRMLDDPARMAGFVDEGIKPFEGAIEELAGWHGFSGRAEDVDELGFPSYAVQQPITNPLRGVGRNDPCPCGSGKKYKKCCLA